MSGREHVTVGELRDTPNPHVYDVYFNPLPSMAHFLSVFREIAAPGVRPTAEADLHRAPAPAPLSRPDHGPARLGPTLRAAPAPTHAPGLQLHPLTRIFVC